MINRYYVGQPARIYATFTTPKVFTANASTNKLAVTAHGFIDGNPVTVRNTGGLLPGGLEEELVYYVVTAAANDFQLALSPGGSAIDLTHAGSGTNEVIGPADQATLVMRLEDPDGEDTTYSLADEELTRLSTGIYYREITPLKKGIWQRRSEGPDGVDQGSFTVVEKNVERVEA